MSIEYLCLLSGLSNSERLRSSMAVHRHFASPACLDVVGQHFLDILRRHRKSGQSDLSMLVVKTDLTARSAGHRVQVCLRLLQLRLI